MYSQLYKIESGISLLLLYFLFYHIYYLHPGVRPIGSRDFSTETSDLRMIFVKES